MTSRLGKSRSSLEAGLVQASEEEEDRRGVEAGWSRVGPPFHRLIPIYLFNNKKTTRQFTYIVCIKREVIVSCCRKREGTVLVNRTKREKSYLGNM